MYRQISIVSPATVLPFGSVAILTHTVHPGVGVTNGDHGHDPVFVDRFGFLRGVFLLVFCR